MSFETQVEGLTSISIDSSGTAPTQSELSQFLSDGAIEVINAMPREKKILCATEETFTSTAFGSEGVSQILTSSEVLSVTRAGEPCRQIPAELAGRASDSSDFASAHMEKATDTDPVWYIYDGKINALPASGACKFLEINRPSVLFSHSSMSTSLSSFPLDCEYLVVLYASIKSLQNAMGNKTSTLPADMTLPTIPASPVSPSFDSGEISISASVPTYTQPVFNPPTLGTVGDLTLPTAPVSPVLTTQSVTLTGDAPVYIAPDYSKVTSFIETDEDVELASVKIQQVSNEARDSLNRFNDGNIEYQANLQKDIQNAQLSDSNEARKLQQYSNELQEYSTTVNATVQKWINEEWNQNFQKYQQDYSSLLQEYNSNLQNSLNKFNEANTVYQNELQEKIQEANNQQGKDTSEYSAQIQKFTNDLQKYSAEVNKSVQDFNTKLQKHTTDYNWLQSQHQQLSVDYQRGLQLLRGVPTPQQEQRR